MAGPLFPPLPPRRPPTPGAARVPRAMAPPGAVRESPAVGRQGLTTAPPPRVAAPPPREVEGVMIPVLMRCQCRRLTIQKTRTIPMLCVTPGG